MPEAEIELAADATGVSAARRFVANFLHDIGDGDENWDAVQLVSELATNAILHARTPFVVRVVVSAQIVRLEVSDRNPALRAVQRHFSEDATTGRGLAMLAMLASSWGVDPRAGAKTVWCELARSGTAGRRDDVQLPVASQHIDPQSSIAPAQRAPQAPSVPRSPAGWMKAV